MSLAPSTQLRFICLALLAKLVDQHLLVKLVCKVRIVSSLCVAPVALTCLRELIRCVFTFACELLFGGPDSTQPAIQHMTYCTQCKKGLERCAILQKRPRRNVQYA